MCRIFQHDDEAWVEKRADFLFLTDLLGVQRIRVHTIVLVRKYWILNIFKYWVSFSDSKYTQACVCVCVCVCQQSL